MSHADHAELHVIFRNGEVSRRRRRLPFSGLKYQENARRGGGNPTD